MPSYKLTYFDVRALGETARLLFTYAGVPFEDVRVTMEQWPELKAKMPWGQLPVLEVDGHTIPQSFAIYRYLANEFGLAGKDALEKAEVDAIADAFKDFYASIGPDYIYIWAGFKEGNAETAHKDVFLPAVEKFLPVFESILQKSGSGFFVKSGLTWVDFFVANNLVTMVNASPDCLKAYPGLAKLKETVHSLPQLQKYLAARPDTKA
uniref:glutathione transferase n=1 Tax=Steinernema glaseri TaxID=37863 RepID=A0A1I7YRG4_9BILA